MTTIVESWVRTFLSLLAVFIFIGAAIYFVISSIDEDQVKKIVLKEVELLTGQKLQVKGALNFTVWPLPTVTMKEVSVAFKTDTKASTLLSAKTLVLRLDPWMLLKMERQVSSNVDMELEIDAFIIEDLKINTTESDQHYYIDLLSGTLQGLNTKKVSIKKLKAQRRKSYLKGDLVFQKNHIDGHLKSEYFDLKDFPGPLSNLALFISKSTSRTTVLNFQFDALQTASILLNNIKLRAQVVGQKIILSPFSFTLAQGIVQGSIILNNGYANINMQANDIIFAKLLNEVLGGNKGLLGGNTQMRLWATGRGSTFDEIISSLTGNAFFVMKNAVLEDKTFQTSVSQLFFKFFHVFNPAIEKEKHTYIQCAALRLDLKEGMAYAKNNFGLETKQFNVWGSGKINLKNKALDFEIYNKPKGKLNIEIGQFAKYVQVGGTIEDPKFSFNPKGLLQEGASIIAGIATGGMSTLAEQVVKMGSPNESACESVIYKKN